MKKDQIKFNSRVIDTWFPDWGIGIVQCIMKTRVRILFRDDEHRSYDFAHLQFLEKR